MAFDSFFGQMKKLIQSFKYLEMVFIFRYMNT